MNTDKLQKLKNPPGFDIDFGLLDDFEQDLDPQSPEDNCVSCHVLGYGEISTVFELDHESMAGLAFKRMSIFKDMIELERYFGAYEEYNRLLEQEIGLNIPSRGHALLNSPAGRPIFYIIQSKLPARSIGNNVIHLLDRDSVKILVERVLQELLKLWSFNQEQDRYKVSIDGQISNWVINDFEADTPRLESEVNLSYIDTSTPVFHIDDVEQFDPELVIRTTPRLLALIIRAFFLEDVMARYYDPRSVAIDLLANFHKEQRPDLIPELIGITNEFFNNGGKQLNVEPITEKEISDYYREDAFIWSFLAASRRIDRFLYLKILSREYPYILPGNVER